MQPANRCHSRPGQVGPGPRAGPCAASDPRLGLSPRVLALYSRPSSFSESPYLTFVDSAGVRPGDGDSSDRRQQLARLVGAGEKERAYGRTALGELVPAVAVVLPSGGAPRFVGHARPDGVERVTQRRVGGV